MVLFLSIDVLQAVANQEHFEEPFKLTFKVEHRGSVEVSQS